MNPAFYDSPIKNPRAWKAFFLAVFFAGLLFCITYTPFHSYRFVGQRLARLSEPGSAVREPGFDGDYVNYVTVARMMREGNNQIYDRRQHVIHGLSPISTTYSPFFYFMMIPWGLLPGGLGADLWLILKLLLIPATALLLVEVNARELPPPGKAGAVVSISLLIFASAPAMEDIIFGQVNLQILFLLCLALYLLQRGKDAAGGLVLGVIFCLKLISAPIIIYLALAKRWKAVAPAAGFIAAVFLAISVLYGPWIFTDYLREFPSSAAPWLNAKNQSIPTLIKLVSPFTGFMDFEYFRHLNPWSSLPCLLIMSLSIYLPWRRRTGDLNMVFSLLTVAMMLSSPIVWAMHHVWLFLPLAFLIFKYFRQHQWKWADLPTLSFLLAILFSMAILDGTSAMGMHYALQEPFIIYRMPLFATLALWGILLFRLGREEEEGTPTAEDAGDAPSGTGEGDARPAAGMRGILPILLLLGTILCGILVLSSYSTRNVLHRGLVAISPPDRGGMESLREEFDGDFRYFLKGAGLIRDRLNPYDPETGRSRGLGSIAATHPPTAYFLFVPLTLIPPRLAADLWFLSKILAAAGAALLLMLPAGTKKAAAGTIWMGILLGICLLSSSPAQEDVIFGQVNIHLLFLLCLALYFARRQNDDACGALLGLVFCIKLTSALILLHFVLQKRWKAAGWAIGVIAAACAGAAVMGGPGIFLSYLSSFGGKAAPWVEDFRNQGLPAVMMEIFGRSGDAWRWAYPIAAAAVVSFSFMAIRARGAGDGSEDYPFAILTTALLIISPITWASHHAWLFIPLAFLAERLTAQERPAPGGLLAGVIAAAVFFFLFALDGCNTPDPAGWDYHARLALAGVKAPAFAVLALWGVLLAWRAPGGEKEAA
jgi:hypothetical protein